MEDTAVVVVLLLLFASSHHAALEPGDTDPAHRPARRPAVPRRVFKRRPPVLRALVYYYLTHRHAGPLLWSVPDSGAVEFLLVLANVIGFVLLVAGVMTPSRHRSPGRPATSRAGRSGSLATPYSWVWGSGPSLT